MPNLLEVFEEALVADPDDIATHMAYADYLQEQGDPRGEFIQVQLALEQRPLERGQRQALKDRATILFNENARQWLGELAPYLLERASRYALPFEFARGWLDRLVLDEFDSKMSRAIRRSPAVRLLRTLRLECSNHLDDDSRVPYLFLSPRLSNLRKLSIRGLLAPASISP